MENNEWLLKEIKTVNFGDKRLNKRFGNVLKNLATNPEASIPQACESWKETKGLYRFLSNSKINADKILQPHIDATIERIKNESTVLLIQDTTEIDFTNHPSTEGLGAIGAHSPEYKNVRRGLYLHSTIAVTPVKNCLGVFDHFMWTRDPEKVLGHKNHSRKLRPIEEKESNRWVEGFRHVKALAKEAPNTRIINVADRESDIFELFLELEDNITNVNMIVRASVNRKINNSDTKLFDAARNGNCLTVIEFELPRGRNNRTARKVIQEVRVAEVTIVCPKRYSPKLPNVKLRIVLATEINPPEGEAPIEWMLLTDINITNAEEAVQIIQYYLCRWQIELYFKILKSGCTVEKIQLEKYERIEACIAVYMIVAWRILHITNAAKNNAIIPCDIIFQESEWKATYLFLYKNKLPENPPSLQEMVNMIAKLGGFLGRKNDALPGIQVIWKGLKRMDDLALAWEIFNAQ